jgi:hypothetical protein
LDEARGGVADDLPKVRIVYFTIHGSRPVKLRVDEDVEGFQAKFEGFGLVYADDFVQVISKL